MEENKRPRSDSSNSNSPESENKRRKASDQESDGSGPGSSDSEHHSQSSQDTNSPGGLDHGGNDGATNPLTGKIMSGNRPVTPLGAQGEHVTAYTMLEEFMFSAFRESRIKDIPSLLVGRLKPLDIGEDLIRDIEAMVKEEVQQYADEGLLVDTSARHRLVELFKNLESLSAAEEASLPVSIDVIKDISSEQIRSIIRLANRSVHEVVRIVWTEKLMI